MLTLFHAPGTCSLAPRIALFDAGAEFGTIEVDVRTGEQHQPAYRKINPKGRVPALATDDGILTENPAILLYIAMSFPGARLAPMERPYALARMQGLNAFIASTLQPGLGPIGHPERYADDPVAQATMKAKALANTIAHFDHIEAEYELAPWVMGDHYTVADAYLFTFSEVIGRLGLDVGRYPRILAHRERMLDRPAVVAALEQTTLKSG
jgi:glutathione S-transferase